MSRAFVKETDDIAPLPERPVSRHPNFVTPQGRDQIEAEAARLAAAFAQAQDAGDRDAMARIGRDLRYWQQRVATMEVVPQPPDHDQVRFGSIVTIERADGSRQTWRIVGEDEADPAQGSLSYVAPLARALTGKGVGDSVTVAGAEAEIVAIA